MPGLITHRATLRHQGTAEHWLSAECGQALCDKGPGISQKPITDLQRARTEEACSAITPYAYDTVTDHESALPLSPRVIGLFLYSEI